MHPSLLESLSTSPCYYRARARLNKDLPLGKAVEIAVDESEQLIQDQKYFGIGISITPLGLSIPSCPLGR